MLNYLRTLPTISRVLLYAAAHNPTNLDTTQENWRQIADVMKTKKLFPFFDTIYQGYASESIEIDAYPIRLFNEMGFQMVVAESYAKNMELYGERIGDLHVVCHTPHTAEKVLS
jgi:aspartate aminotransferase